MVPARTKTEVRERNIAFAKMSPRAQISVQQLLLLLVSCAALAQCQTVSAAVPADVPVELVECTQLLSNATGDRRMIYDVTPDTYVNCLQQFFWKDGSIQWSDFNVTKDDQAFVNSLIRSFVGRGRSKRAAGMGPRPHTGFRIRQEYRRLTDRQRNDFHMALNVMYRNGQYKMFAKMHRGIVLTSAHGGPGFAGWHRIFVVLAEEAMRRVKPWISFPYWDTTLDYEMPNPVDSIIWTPAFLGNGNGHVVKGPFAGWKAPGGPLTRNIGRGSTLISKEMVNKILSRCRITEISYPTAMDKYNFELYHGGPHIWVGGHFSGINTAGHDPVFFLYHSFIDYIYEMFRIRQATVCGINPATDYPMVKGQHNGKRPMDGFPQFRTIDGISNVWTQYWYRYEPSPTCSRKHPSCGSPYLYCNMKRHRCVSVARRPGGGPNHGSMMPGSYASARIARAQESSINYGIQFRAPPPEPRTQDGSMAYGK